MNNQELIQCVKRQKALSNQSGIIENKKVVSELLQNRSMNGLQKLGTSMMRSNG